MSDDTLPSASIPPINDNSSNNLNPSTSVNNSTQLPNFNSISLNKMNLEESSVEVCFYFKLINLTVVDIDF